MFNYPMNMLNMFGSSIYGGGVLNDTIIPGYGVTKAPVNLNAFWSLPNGTIRNFGGATQYVTYPMGYPSIMYALAKNFTSPNHISQWNPMLIGTGIDLTGTSTTSSALTQLGQSMAYNWGYNLALQQQLQSAVKSIAQTLNSLETSLNNVLKSDSLTASQKAKVEKMLEKLEAKKAEIAEKLQGEQTTETVTVIQKEVLDLQKEISDMAEEISKEIKEKNDSEKAEKDSSTDKSDSSSNKVSKEDDKSTNKDNKTTPKTKTKKAEHDEKVKSMKDVCYLIDAAISGPRTNYDDDEKGLKNVLSNPALVNKDNIIELFEQWKKSYEGVGDYKDDKDGLIESLMDDCEGGQKTEIANIIIKLLEERADDLGVDVSKEVAAARTAAKGHWTGWHEDDDIQSTVNSLYDKVKKANDAKIQKADNDTKAKETKDKNKANNDKKTAEQKIKEKRNKVIAEKKAEFARDMKIAMKLTETPEIATAVEVKTDNKGEFTGYSIKIEGCEYKAVSYNSLVKKLAEYGLKPEDYLVKKAVKA